MKIILATDGSPFTRKALAYLMAQEGLLAAPNELVVVHVQPPLPPGVKRRVGAAAVAQYHEEEAEKVLKPVRRYLEQRKVQFSAGWTLGVAADEIVKACKREKARLIVMGTHGHGLLGRALLGSVAQRVLSQSTVPVLLVK